MPDFMSIKKLVSKVKEQGQPAGSSNGSRFGPGISNTGEGAVIVQGDDRSTRVNLILRGLQTFFALVAMLIAVFMATFQTKWVGAPSGLTGLLLFVTAASMLVSIIFFVVPFIHERSGYKTFKQLHRILSEARVGMVTNGIFVGLTLIVAVTQTISAYISPGCKDPEKDPHAVGPLKNKYVAEIPGWCRTKRAEAAFLWFLWIVWVLTLLLFLRQWQIERKQGPRIPPFVHPTDDSAFEPINEIDEEDQFDDENQMKTGGRYGDGGDGTYGSGAPVSSQITGGPGAGAGYNRQNPLADIEAKYGMATYNTGDPFADRPYSRPSYDYNAYDSHHDPYSVIQHQLQTGRPEPPPQPPNLGYGAYR